LVASSVIAQEASVLNITGYLYESDNTTGVDGFAESNPGDILAGYGFVTDTNEPLEWSQDNFEYTWYMYDLVSEGTQDLGNNLIRIMYSSGHIDIIADRYVSPDHSSATYGIDPPQSQYLDTFTNGRIYLHGTFSNFALTYNTETGNGNFEGDPFFEVGPWYQSMGYYLDNPAGYSVVGVVNSDNIGTIPDGFDLYADGNVYHYSTVPNDDVSWGSIKNMFH